MFPKYFCAHNSSFATMGCLIHVRVILMELRLCVKFISQHIIFQPLESSLEVARKTIYVFSHLDNNSKEI